MRKLNEKGLGFFGRYIKEFLDYHKRKDFILQLKLLFEVTNKFSFNPFEKPFKSLFEYRKEFYKMFLFRNLPYYSPSQEWWEELEYEERRKRYLERYERVVSHFEKMGDCPIVFRIVLANPETYLKRLREAKLWKGYFYRNEDKIYYKKGFGNSWTWDKQSLGNFSWDFTASNHRGVDPKDNEDIEYIIVEGIVPQRSIKWDSTLGINIMQNLGWEKEVVLKQNARVKVIGLQIRKNQSSNKEVLHNFGDISPSSSLTYKVYYEEMNIKEP